MLPSGLRWAQAEDFPSHRHRKPGDCLEIRVFIAAILAGAHRSALVGHQRTHRGDRAHHRGEGPRDHLLFGQHHRRVAEAAGGVARRMHAVTRGDLMDGAPQETHVAHAQRAQRENDRRNVAGYECVVVQFLAAHRFDAEQFRAFGRRAFEELQHAVVIIAAAHLWRTHELAVVIRCDAQHGFQAMGVLVFLHALEQHAHN